MSEPEEPGVRRWRLDLAGSIQLLVVIALAGSVVYTLVRLAAAPEFSVDPAVRVRSDYILTLIQCVGGLIVLFLPTFVTRTFAVRLPSGMQIAYFGFLYAAIYLGEVRDFYYRFAAWDAVLHFFSGMMLAAFGFQLVRILNDAGRAWLALSPGFVAFFAFCFALTCGTVWEIYEFTMDGLAGTNMQKVVLATGEVLVGREALVDTMEDLMLDAAAAILVAVIGYLSLRRERTLRAGGIDGAATMTP